MPEQKGVRLEQHTVPFPQSISPEARSFLESMVGSDGIPLNALYPMPEPNDTAAWIRLRESVDAHYASMLASGGEERTGSLETLTIDKTKVYVAVPDEMKATDCVYLDIHGGAFVFGGGETCRQGAIYQANQCGIACWGIDYRMPPEHPFPAALDDCMATYRKALECYAPGKIIVGGRSAGGNLAAATVLRARDEGLPLPAGVVLISPEVDLTESGDSFAVNRMLDVNLPDSLMRSILLYASSAKLTLPYLSPLFAELSGFPVTLLLSGTRDLFLSNTVRMHRALRQVDVDAELHIFEAMPHGGFMGAPEDKEAQVEIMGFVHGRLSI